MTVDIQREATGSIFHIRATGKLTRDDYAHWVPALDAQVETHGNVSILFEMSDFHGWTAGALWDDLKFGFRHFTKIDRIAIVGEKPWQKGMAVFCRPFTMARIRYFSDTQKVEAALDWLRQSNAQSGAMPTFDIEDVPVPIAELLNILAGQDGSARKVARGKLVDMGPSVAAHLFGAAQGGPRQLRLEATRTLAAIADPSSVAVLAGQFDDSLEIGWAAAEGVKQLGREGAVAALQQLLQHPDSHGVRSSAHHALRHMEAAAVHAAVAPVATALLDEQPIAAVTVAADAAMAVLRAH